MHVLLARAACPSATHGLRRLSGRPASGGYRWWAALVWLSLFVLLALLPLALVAWRAPEPRSLAVEAGAVLGVLGLGLLLTQAVCSGRFAAIAPQFGADNVAHFHRHVGFIAVVLVLCHPLTLVVAEPAYLEYLDPRADVVRAAALWVLLAALLLIAISSQWRERLGLSYEYWRVLHGGLAVLIFIAGTGHALMVGHYFDTFWKQCLLASFAGVATLLVLWTRVLRPWRSRRRPWRVESVTAERGKAWTMRLAPQGHAGLSFKPGQYVWFSLGGTPFTLQQHPFSLSGSADSRQLSITASEAGDFTRSLGPEKVGSTAWVEGPYGSFVPDPDPETGLFLVAGGIGITPFMSMLRTFSARDVRRRIVLIYANPTLQEATFHDELQSLCTGLDVRLVHVLEEPPQDWQGERGLVDAQLLQRYLPDPGSRVQYMICGPEPLMDAVETALRARGEDWRQVYCERFNLV